MKPAVITALCLTLHLASYASTIPPDLRATTVPTPAIKTSSPNQDYTAIAAIALGLPSDQQVKLNLAGTEVTEPVPQREKDSSPVPEPTTAIFIGSGIFFGVVSRLRKRQDVFDYYNK